MSTEYSTIVYYDSSTFLYPCICELGLNALDSASIFPEFLVRVRIQQLRHSLLDTLAGCLYFFHTA
jgi:hypothetical protein